MGAEEGIQCVRENAGYKSRDALLAVMLAYGGFFCWKAVARGSWLADDMLAILGAAFCFAALHLMAQADRGWPASLGLCDRSAVINREVPDFARLSSARLAGLRGVLRSFPPLMESSPNPR